MQPKGSDEYAMGTTCIVCGADRWAPLDDPHPSRSVRVDGVVEDVPLGKVHCRGCGLAYRPSHRDVSQLYENEFLLYGNRPGAEVFSQSRYAPLTQLLVEAVGSMRPTRILEVGCGNGTMLTAVRRQWPHAVVVGLEPSEEGARLTRKAGHNVVRALLGSSVPGELEGRFDLIYSNHVIEHTDDPVRFLRASAERLTPDGVVVTICPNGAVPHAELIHSDHLYSFTPRHLASVATQADLSLRIAKEFVLEEGPEYNQVLVAYSRTHMSTGRSLAFSSASPEEVEGLQRSRNAYLRGWSRLEGQLSSRIGSATNVVCFGTGGWAARLAGYAPQLWGRVQACAVDAKGAERFCEKPVLDYHNLDRHRPDAVIVATSPPRQEAIASRMGRDGFQGIRWNDLIDR